MSYLTYLPNVLCCDSLGLNATNSRYMKLRIFDYCRFENLRRCEHLTVYLSSLMKVQKGITHNCLDLASSIRMRQLSQGRMKEKRRSMKKKKTTLPPYHGLVNKFKKTTQTRTMRFSRSRVKKVVKEEDAWRRRRNGSHWRMRSWLNHREKRTNGKDKLWMEHDECAHNIIEAGWRYQPEG
ncbi:hypothetical protein P8452_77518 [Trifolium repens]|nr:hypothetical protein P8452_77518 [Trifolium repens]